MKKLVSAVMCLLMLLSASAEYQVTGVEFYNKGADIGQNRVFYEIFTGTFSDSDGDGIGDIRGIINRLDYLNDGNPESGYSLGVEGLWLTPVFASPSYHKYDVTDYYKVDPAFGTNEDLKELAEKCHERDMLLIIDLPINHTGSLNKWFNNFKSAHIVNNPDNAFYDFYSWLPASSSFPAGRHFARVQGADILVEANFSDSMPEINFDSEYARNTLVKVAKYWLDMGVDGFRFDAAKYVYFGDHAKSAEFWEWYMQELKSIKPDIYCVAEVWDSDSVTARYQKAFNCFNFTASQAEGLIATIGKGSNANKFTSYIERHINDIKAINPDAMNVLFIANHDTDRCAGYLTAASWKLQMAANLYILSPGSPFIYYGEELAMRGSRGGSNTDANRRLAMLWNDGDTVKDPVGTTYEKANQTPYGVSELIDKDSGILSYYKKLLMVRKANPEIAAGSYKALSFSDTKLGGFVSELDGECCCVLHNPTSKAVTVNLSDVTDIPFSFISAYIGKGTAELNGTTVTVDAQTSCVIRQ